MGASEGGRAAPAPRGTPEHDAQRLLLHELITSPPPDGDRIAPLANRLGFSVAEIEAAARVLVAVGLARREGEALFATPPALAFDALLNVRL